MYIFKTKKNRTKSHSTIPLRCESVDALTGELVEGGRGEVLRERLQYSTVHF